MKTPSQIEKSLADAFRKYENTTHQENLENIIKAKATYRKVRASYGIASPSKLLTQTISKLNKNETPTYGLAIIPAGLSEIGNVCAFAGECASTCVAFSGNGSFSNTVNSRKAKTDFMVNHPFHFIVLLCDEMAAIHENSPGTTQIRLNTYSDIRWERIFADFMRQLYSIEFYDYTKHPMSSRPANSLPDNYRLTYSVSEKTTANEIKKARDHKRNIAVVVSIRSGKTATGWRPIPATWANILTVDGDLTDDRFNDPIGTVVVLRRKHTMKPWHPMIQQGSKLNKGILK